MNLLRNTKVALPLAATGALATAAVAWAAPDRDATIAEGTPYSWDGGPVTGTPFATVDDDDTLVTLSGAGTLKVALSEPSDNATDIDLYVYKSDDAGEPKGDPIVSAETGGSDESVSAKISGAGKYLIRVSGWAAAEGTYKGKATFTSSAAAPAPQEPGTGGNPGTGTSPANGTPANQTQPGPDNAPVATIGKLAKSAKAKKVKTFSGTASDDKGVAKVEIALVLKKGKKCTQLTSKGTFKKLAKCQGPTSFVAAKGTTSWSYKLKKRLKKGSYTLFARATDSAGQQQGGFSASNKKTFKVK